MLPCDMQRVLMTWAADALRGEQPQAPVPNWLRAYEQVLNTDRSGSDVAAAMVPIFEIVARSSSAPVAESVAQPMLALDTILPDPDCAAPLDLQAFQREIAPVLKASESATAFETFGHVLRKYAWAVPCTYGQTGVSLYEEFKALAAIAAASGWQDVPAGTFTLVGGDLSGIQEFIFNVTSQAAAKGLRGRSFFLQLLGDGIVRRLVHELDLCWANVIYEAGGNFLLLAPAGENTHSSLQHILEDVNDSLLDSVGGDLALVMAWDEIEAKDLGTESFTAARNGVGELLASRKNERYLDQLRNGGYARLFDSDGTGATEDGYCHVCHRELRGKSTEQEGVQKCEFCSSFESLARAIAHDDLWTVVQPVESQTNRDDWQSLLERVSGFRYRFDTEKPTTSASGGYAYHWNNTERTLVHEGYRFAANNTPRIDEDDIVFAKEAGLLPPPVCKEIKDFELIAAQAEGIKRVGVLRMDVDNLGTIFGEGLQASMPQLSALSAAMTLFFCGHLNRICELIEAGLSKTLYTIYAGGDDLFVVGAWDRMPALAQAIHDDFQKYTGRHPSFTISGGVALEGAHFPLYRAAERSAEAEHQAKQYSRYVPDKTRSSNPIPDCGADGAVEERCREYKKDAFSFLGTAVGWEDWCKVKAMRDALDGLLLAGVPSNLLQLCLGFYRQWEAAPEITATNGPRVKYGRWEWMAAYLLTRMARRYEASQDELLTIQKDWIGGGTRILWLGVTARWVELLRRSVDQEVNRDRA